MLKIAQHILETKEADFDPSQFVDHYEEAVVEMLRKKQAGLATPKGKAGEPPRNVINLMDALKKSLADKGARPEAKKSKKRIEGQREMLLSIAGKKGQGSLEARGKTGNATEDRLARERLIMLLRRRPDWSLRLTWPLIIPEVMNFRTLADVWEAVECRPR